MPSLALALLVETNYSLAFTHFNVDPFLFLVPVTEEFLKRLPVREVAMLGNGLFCLFIESLKAETYLRPFVFNSFVRS